LPPRAVRAAKRCRLGRSRVKPSSWLDPRGREAPFNPERPAGRIGGPWQCQLASANGKGALIRQRKFVQVDGRGSGRDQTRPGVPLALGRVLSGPDEVAEDEQSWLSETSSHEFDRKLERSKEARAQFRKSAEAFCTPKRRVLKDSRCGRSGRQQTAGKSSRATPERLSGQSALTSRMRSAIILKIR